MKLPPVSSTVESRFFELPRETEIRSKNREFEKSRLASTENKSKGNEFRFEKSEGSKNRGLEKSRFHCITYSYTIFDIFCIYSTISRHMIPQNTICQ